MKINLSKIPNKFAINFSKIGDILWFLGHRAFLIILFFVFIFAIFGAVVFYQKAYLPELENPSVDSALFKFKEDIYQKILAKWQERSRELEGSLEESYVSPF